MPCTHIPQRSGFVSVADQDNSPQLRDSTSPTPSNNELDMNDLTTWLRPSPTVHVGECPATDTGWEHLSCWC